MAPPDQLADYNGRYLKFAEKLLCDYELTQQCFKTFLETAQVRGPGD